MTTQKRFFTKTGIDNNGNTLINVANPVGEQDAVPKQFAVNASNLSAGTVAAARLPALTGDVTSVAGSGVLTLGASGASAGTTGSTSVVPVITVDTRGRVTAVAAATITPGAIGAVAVSALGVNGGVATLDGTGKLSTDQIPGSLVGSLNYQGTWNAQLNTPTLASSVGTKGHYWKVSVAGSTALNAQSYWVVGDLLIYSGSSWDRVEGGATEVSTVAGRVGNVVLTSADVAGLGSLATQSGTFTGSSTGTNTGDNATNTQYAALVSNATHTGDVSGSGALTLATVNTNVGTFGTNALVPVLTVNAKGLVTGVSTSAITPASIGAQPAGSYTSGSGSATGTNTGDQLNIAGNAGTASAVAFSGITGRPTTLAGYGITDATGIEFNAHVVDLNNPHAVSKAQVGLSSVGNFPMAVAEDLANATQKFSDIFNAWTRYSHSGATQPASASEMASWAYNNLTDQITSTINSSTHIGFVSNTSFGDYVFEAEVSSTNRDDDIIGLVIGFIVVDGVEFTLSAYRILNNQVNTFVVVYNAGLTGVKIFGSNMGGMASNPHQNVGTPTGTGWEGLTARLRAVRVGSTIEITTSAINTSTTLASTKITVDLDADPVLHKFRASSRIGFMCQSQTASTWKFIESPWARHDRYMSPKNTVDVLSTTLASYSTTAQINELIRLIGKPPITSSFSGPIEVVVGNARYYPARDIVITSVYFSVGTAPASGGSVQLNVKLNGLSIFTGALPTLSAGQNKSTIVSVRVPVSTLQYLTIDVPVSSGGASDATVFLVIE